jgi:hypothetical protein
MNYFKSLLFFLFLSQVSLSQTISKKSNNISLDVSGITPKITWFTPTSYETPVLKKEYRIKVGIKSHGKLKSADLYLNNRLVGESRGFRSLKEGYDKIIEREVRLRSGENTIKIVATSTDDITSTDSRILKLAATESSKSRTDYALLIGINQYDEWSNLFNPVDDVKAIAKELRSNYGFQTEVVTDLTTSEIMSKLREYAKKSYLSNDQLFIFFAGHGQFDDVFTEGYLVGKDSKEQDPGKTSYISHSTLRTIVNNIPSKHIFLAMDVCFGGTFDPLVARAGSRGLDDIYSDITKEEFINRRLQWKTRKYVTSGGKQYVADGKPGGHSPFARKFLMGLRGYGGQDKILTLQELYGYLLKLRVEPHAGEFGENEPGSDFVFVAKE